VRGALLALSVALALVPACKAGWNDPPPPPPGQICNNLEIPCVTQKSCCPTGQTCGGEPTSVGCPAGGCCDIGPGFEAALADGGIRPMRLRGPQRKP
jgi:hypothetical protein